MLIVIVPGESRDDTLHAARISTARRSLPFRPGKRENVPMPPQRPFVASPLPAALAVPVAACASPQINCAARREGTLARHAFC
jgi:hypothetical protein